VEGSIAVSFHVEVFAPDEYAEQATSTIARALPANGTVVITGGSTAEAVYPHLAQAAPDWSGREVYFSDERCVPPDDDASNYGMVRRTLLDHIDVGTVHRMRGEDPPLRAADSYHVELSGRDIPLMLLGMGADNHICGMFPHSEAIKVTSSLCTPVDRPDGLKGLTLTPPAVTRAGKVLLLVTGDKKADAVRRAVEGYEDPFDCPARMLANHPDATFLLDEPAASLLSA
jgi:6-phosphogluconolactonase